MRQVRSDSLYLVPRYNWIAAAVGAAASIGSAIYNMYSQKKNNDKVEDFTREQYDYNKQLNETIMAREDTAYQRAVADAQAAGLSPLVTAGTGGAGSGGTVSQSNLSMNTQAPQIEPNTFMDAMRALEQESMQKRQIDAQNKSQDKQIGFETMKLQTQLDAQNEMLDKQLEAAAQTQDKELADREAARIEQSKQFNAQLNFLIDSKNQDYILEMQKDAVHSASAMGITKLNFVTSQEELKAGYDAFTQAYLDAGDRAMKNYYADHGLGADNVAETTSGSSSSSSGVSTGLSGSASAGGSGHGSSGHGSSGFGASGSLGANYSAGDSQGDSVTKSSSVYDQMRNAQVSAGNRVGFPVLVPKVKRRD